ncbi:MAG TPA: DUF1905 domain-containing protein [Chloroflexota bacterium]|nr:DUF1905 domain-containing protein [Chloroflexota bacterium]
MTDSVRATLQDNAPGLIVELPAETVEQLGAGKRPPVNVTMVRQAHPERSTYRFSTRVAVYGGRFYLGLRKDQRAASGLAPGDTVDVELELDAERTRN